MTHSHRIVEAGLLYAALALLGFGFPDNKPFGALDLLLWAVIGLLLWSQPQGQEDR